MFGKKSCLVICSSFILSCASCVELSGDCTFAGTMNGDTSDDFLRPDGTYLDVPADPRSELELVHDGYGEHCE